jgi:Uma2 family endonuclease
MAATTNLLTWEAFEQLPDDDWTHYEIIEGELISLPPPKSRHSNIASNTYKALLPLEERGLGRVYLEAGYKLSENPPTWIQPDASFLRASRVQATAPDGYFIGAPELAVEIVSPPESARMLNRKVKALPAAGGGAVWVTYPDDLQVRVYLPDGALFNRGIDDTLSAPDLLPDWQLPVAKLFED